ncbi:MAG: ribosomal protein [Acidobacteria bacterium]|jgi:large subunit ribosomal protein L2|nr:ribosomal protein [Acidobacteriota bacterium]
MAIKTYRPTSPAIRFRTTLENSELSKERPLKKLSAYKQRISGRNNKGRLTIRHRGGGHRKLYRIVDFRRDKHEIPAKVVALEYDPNRSARIALLSYADGEKRYILAPNGLAVGATVIASDSADILIGNALPLKNIPLGTMIHNIEIKKGKGGQLARAAGMAAQLLAKEAGYAQIKFPSGETRMIHQDCFATIGQVGNLDHENVSIGKAGRSRWLGKRPTVRGVVMNPIDHPHGGGEGKTSGGRHPVSPWGLPTKGYKTRNNKRTQRFIIKRRGKK